jgi:hypothetical protein
MGKKQQMVFFLPATIGGWGKAANGVFASSVATIGIESDL